MRYGCCFAIALLALAQTNVGPEILKDSISIHRVLRGDMPPRQAVGGSVNSLTLRTIAISLPAGLADQIRTGQKASVQVKPPQVLAGTVTRVAGTEAEVTLEEPLPAGVSTGTKVGTMIEVGVLTDVVYYERPATARENSETYQFVLEPDGEHARRVRVKYGRLSGALIEIVGGLSPSDRVIVTDTSKSEVFERVRLK